MEHIANLTGAVTGFHITGPYIDCICGKDLLKIEKSSGVAVCKKQIFAKEGFSRDLLADGGQIVLYDFCALYLFRQQDYELLGSWRLGENLRSDICGIAADQDTIYCSIRNGTVFTLDRTSYLRKAFQAADSSMWSIKPYGAYLVCGTVGGNLLLLNKAGLSTAKTLALGKKNIGSLYLHGGLLYAASQDGTLFKINMRDFAVDAAMKNAHKKMFRCAGIYSDMVVTVSHPCSEIALWDRDTLEKRDVIHIPLQLSGHACIENNDALYLSSAISWGSCGSCSRISGPLPSSAARQGSGTEAPSSRAAGGADLCTKTGRTGSAIPALPVFSGSAAQKICPEGGRSSCLPFLPRLKHQRR